MIRLGRLLAVLLFAATAGIARTARASPSRSSKSVTSSPEAGGTHIRIETRTGPVHLFRPAGYDRRTAGIVVYVHGYYVHADEAWREHKLARQFAASRRNALFIVPEAPAGPEEKSLWTDLRPRVTAALRRAGLDAPRGPLIVAGHSAAYRTIVPWLGEASLHHVILIDALYGNENDFRAWLDGNPANHMTLVVKGTAKWADPFVQAIPDAMTVPEIPRQIAELTRAERGARVLALRSQYGHFELMSEGKVLPVLLGRTPLTAVRRPPARR